MPVSPSKRWRHDAKLDLYLPPEVLTPLGVKVSFVWTRAFEEANRPARLATPSMLGSLSRQLGELDRVVVWLQVDGLGGRIISEWLVAGSESVRSASAYCLDSLRLPSSERDRPRG